MDDAPRSDVLARTRAMREYAIRTREEAITMRRRARAVREMLDPEVSATRVELATAAFMALPAAAALVGADGRVVATNRRWRHQFGGTLLVGDDFRASWHLVKGDEFVADALRRVLAGEAGTDIETELPRGGAAERGLVQIAPTTPDVGAALVVVLDITAQHRLEQALLFDATHDGLTGLLNRVALIREVGDALERRRRYGQRFGLVYLDLDGFKAVNDAHGHATGDALLQGVAARWRDQVRAPDLLGRMGGDEFVVLVPYLEDVKQLLVLARRLADALAEPFRLPSAELRIGVTAGIAEPPPSVTAEDAFGLADHAMYAVKRAKRPVPAEADGSST